MTLNRPAISPITITLLALLLALRELETPLSDAEKAKLNTTRQQLQLAPGKWARIEVQLLATIAANAELNQKFQSYKDRLTAGEFEIQPEFIPTLAELEQEIPLDRKTVNSFGVDSSTSTRSATPATADADARMIAALTRTLAGADNPGQAASRVSAIDRAQKALSLPISPEPFPNPSLEDNPFALEAERSVADEALQMPEPDLAENDGSSPESAPVEQRYLNSYFSPFNQPGAMLPDRPLVARQAYGLTVEVSPERKGIERTNVPFPDAAVAQAFDPSDQLALTVIVASQDFEIDAPNQKSSNPKTLILPRQGAADPVFFKVRPKLPDAASMGRGAIQIDIFYRGYLLQSKLLESAIVPSADAVPATSSPFQVSAVTFTTIDRFSQETLALLPERILTIIAANHEPTSSISFRFLDRTQGGRELATYSEGLYRDSLNSVIQEIRTLLGHLAAESYCDNIEGDLTLLNHGLHRLADLGRSLYRQILYKDSQATSSAGKTDRTALLQAALKAGTVIQVNSVLGWVTIPWAVLYERPLRLTDQTQVCDRFQNHDDCSDCPFQTDATRVCPHAFWGYRYSIEQLPGQRSANLNQSSAIIRQIDNNQPLSVNLNVWRDFDRWRDHCSKLQQMGTVEMHIAETLADLDAIWQAQGPALDLVYFYCHGGTEGSRPYLRLSDGRINSNYLESFNLNWSHHPLVLLNGCATGDYSPASYISLIDDFRRAQACGVVGTECPVSENFAETYATELLKRLFRGEPIGQAMLAIRRYFMQQFLNPMGLVYSLYAADEICLLRAVARP